MIILKEKYTAIHRDQKGKKFGKVIVFIKSEISFNTTHERYQCELMTRREK